MGAKERREREKAATRQMIVDAARELLVQEGYEALTMRKLAERIEYSPTAIYVHFADKEALVAELCVCDFKQFTDQFGLVPRELPAVDRLRALGAAYVRFAAEHPEQYRYLFMTEREVPPEALAAKPEEDAYDLLMSAVNEAIAAGDFHPGWKDQAQQVAQVLWGALHGLVAMNMTVPKNTNVRIQSVDELAAVAVHILLNGFKAPPPGPRSLEASGQ